MGNPKIQESTMTYNLKNMDITLKQLPLQQKIQDGRDDSSICFHIIFRNILHF